MDSTETRTHRWASWAVGGAVLSALAASACCWLPLLALAVGVSSAGLAQKLAVYRPYFVALALAALGGAFYLTYRRPRASAPRPSSDDRPAAEAAEACCAVPPAAPRWVHRLQHFNRIVLWPIAGLVLAVALFPDYVNTLFPKTPAPGPSASAGPSPAVHEIRFRVEGMDCAMCAVGIRAALERLPGVVAAEVNYPDGSARVRFRDVPPSEMWARLRDRIEAMGYRAIPAQTPDPTHDLKERKTVYTRKDVLSFIQSPNPTPYEVRDLSREEPVYVRCAMDALLYPLLTGQKVEVVARPPGVESPLRLVVGPDGAETWPSGWVVTYVDAASESERLEQTARERCPFIHLFPDRESLEKWLSGLRPEVRSRIRVLGIGEAFAQARHWVTSWPEGCC